MNMAIQKLKRDERARFSPQALFTVFNETYRNLIRQIEGIDA